MRKINSGVPQGSVSGPIFFLILINDLPDGITSLCKIFADDSFLFAKVDDIGISAKELNHSLKELVNEIFIEKFNLILIPINRQMKLFFLENQTTALIPLLHNNNEIRKCPHQKHLDIVLDSKLDFKFHVDQKIETCNKLARRISVCLKEGLTDLTYLTMVIFYMINQKMQRFKINLKSSI